MVNVPFTEDEWTELVRKAELILKGQTRSYVSASRQFSNLIMAAKARMPVPPEKKDADT